MSYSPILNPHPVSISGTVTTSGLTDTQLRASAVPISVASLPALAAGGNVIGGVTQSGTWNVTVSNASLAITAASLPLPTGAALDATLTGGTLKAIARGGAKGSTTAADVTSTASGSNHQPLDVALYDGSGNLKDPTQVRALTSSDQITVANATLAVTQSGTWNVGTITTLPALVAGSALIGKVGLDQTTPGTTNAVAVAQIGSTTIASGNGVVSAGVQRVAIASDNTAFSVNAVQSGSWSLAANQSVNVAQMNGVTVTMNSGVVGTGVQRVVLATDVALPTGSNVIGALTANQSVNNAQIAGTTTATSNGTASAGCQRVTIASDNTAFSVNATGPTLTKATQGSTGYSVQDLKDSGRTSIMVTASVASTATSETLITVSKSSGLAAVTTASSNTITTGKRFRIQGIYASARNTTGTTAGVATIKFRAAVAGSTTTASPLQMTTAVALPAAATSVVFPDINIPDGFEIDSNSATNTWGITITHPQWVTGSVVATFDITMIGFEY